MLKELLISQVEWLKKRGRSYSILNVVGADEYATCG
jgi:trehalose/maltose hydrolase-like predicted phosphorylase